MSTELPVAVVAVDVSLPHLDRLFDYLVPENLSAEAQPGVRVRVRFAGRLIDGFVLARKESTEHTGKLGLLQKVVSAEPALAPEIAVLARTVADRYAGTLADVIRLAVPPRHARGEKSALGASERAAADSTGADRSTGADGSPGPDDSIGSDDSTGPDRRTGADDSTGADGNAGPDKREGGDEGGTSDTGSTPDGGAAADEAAVTDDEGAATGGGSTTHSAPAQDEVADDPVATAEPDRVPDGPIQREQTPGWDRYPAGPAFLTALRTGRTARAVWQMLPGEDWPTRLAEAAAAALAAGRGTVLVLPDVGELARVDAALTAVLPARSHVTLTADLGPETRYRRFVQIRRGEVKVVAGTRAAAFAPVADLGLAVIIDDGDDHHAEPRAPYPHAREVLMLRSAQTGSALLVGGFARTAEAALLVESGWAREIVADRATVRTRAPRIEAAGDEFARGADSAAARARISPAAFQAARTALESGAPVLVQVPRRGYLPSLGCARCRRPARCRHCHGPLALRGPDQPPACRWCGIAEAHFVCGACGSTALRSTVVGTRRTAEELGRAFPNVPALTSAGDTIRSDVPASPQLVVATPGAEPVADGGYGAALLLDGSTLLIRPDLRAAEEALRRWMIAAALVRPARDGGRVVVGADSSLPTVQALIRWDPAGHAAAELAARRELGFPPAAAMAALEGEDAAVAEALTELRLPDTAEVLGPVPVEDLPSAVGGGMPGPESAGRVRALIRSPQRDRKAVAADLTRLTALRSARKGTATVRVQIDPDALF
ncbi:hypothetical protein GIS00_09020 [Nakamurella sp. YIM 132087]|uniref:Probable replication restart protein PriA n=1 Tax=Nakamurella alba TaxID=2665158 RepID=A0A7K1FIY6_9ACTN|nr:hypothetical protein [Nakamurella alba]